VVEARNGCAYSQSKQIFYEYAQSRLWKDAAVRAWWPLKGDALLASALHHC